MNRKRLIGIVVLGMLTTTFSSCRIEKHIGANEQVLRHNRFVTEITDSTVVESQVHEALSGVKNYAVQSPNQRILDFRVKMRAYVLSNPDKDNLPNRLLRKIGEAPVIIDENATRRTTNQIRSLLDSKGCFGSAVYADLEPKRHGQADVVYHIKPRPRYIVDEVLFSARTEGIDTLLDKWAADSYIKVGDCYDQALLTKERERISTQLQNQGYYLATTDIVTFVVDTTYAQNRLSVEVVVNNPRVNGTERQLQKYHIGEVYIYPNSISMDPEKAHDTLDVQYHLRKRDPKYRFVYDSTMSIKPLTLCQSMFVFSGQTYRPRSVKNTYNSLLDLKNFKYIGIEFKESPLSTDTNRLVDAHVRLQNNVRQRVSASFELSNMSSFGNTTDSNTNFLRNGNFGLETVLEYQNRNFFRHAEIFKASASLLVELPKISNGSTEFHDIFSSFENGLDLSLDIPQFILPFANKIVWQRTRPHTNISLGTYYQYRNYFERLMFDASFGYSWRSSQTGNHNNIQHQLYPVELAYVKFFNLDSNFLSRLNTMLDDRLIYQYSDHFIMDARYSYTYSTQQIGTRSNFSYVNAGIETAGNLLNAMSLMVNGAVDSSNHRQIFGVPYSQYVKFTVDAKHYFYHGKKNTFVARAMAGIGLPYANSSALPYEKSFYGGGPSTMRAWQLRKLGPGGYQGAGDAYERIGDISIVANLEERFPIIGPFEGALFLDAGNIWLMNTTEAYPEGEWKWNKFYKEFAVGTGFGLRLNISILTVRLDLAIPLIDPGYPEGQRWRPEYWKFSDIVTNIGIDYPF